MNSSVNISIGKVMMQKRGEAFTFLFAFYNVCSAKYCVCFGSLGEKKSSIDVVTKEQKKWFQDSLGLRLWKDRIFDAASVYNKITFFPRKKSMTERKLKCAFSPSECKSPWDSQLNFNSFQILE